MRVKPSGYLAILQLLLHTVAAIIVYATTASQASKLAVFILIMLSLLYYLARDVLLLFPGSWREFSYDLGAISVVTRGGSSFLGQVASKTTVSPYCIVLHLRMDGRLIPAYRAIFPDTLDTDEFRELCVRLRFIQ